MNSIVAIAQITGIGVSTLVIDMTFRKLGKETLAEVTNAIGIIGGTSILVYQFYDLKY